MLKNYNIFVSIIKESMKNIRKYMIINVIKKIRRENEKK